MAYCLNCKLPTKSYDPDILMHIIFTSVMTFGLVLFTIYLFPLLDMHAWQLVLMYGILSLVVLIQWIMHKFKAGACTICEESNWRNDIPVKKE